MNVLRYVNDTIVKLKRYTPAQLLHEHELYTVVASNDPSDALFGEEEVFSPHDNAAAPVIQETVRSGAMPGTASSRRVLNGFLYLLALRNSRRVREYAAAADDLLNESMAAAEREATRRGLKRNEKAPRIEDMLDRKNLAKFLVLGQAIGPGFDAAVQATFGNLWMAVKTWSDPPTLITGEHPVVALPRFGDEFALYIVPLAPRAAVVASAAKKLFDGAHRAHPGAFCDFTNYAILADNRMVAGIPPSLEAEGRRFLGIRHRDTRGYNAELTRRADALQRP